MFWNVTKEEPFLKHKGETRRGTYRINDIVPEQLQLSINGVTVEIKDISADGMCFLFNNNLDDDTKAKIEQLQTITAEIYVNVSMPQSVQVNVDILSRRNNAVAGEVKHTSACSQKHLCRLMMDYQKERIRSRKAELHNDDQAN